MICEKNNCVGCFACAFICPTGCIKAKNDIDGFKYPIIDKSNCISCGRCDSVCPVNKELRKITDQRVYALKHKSSEVLSSSSSGGAFYAFSKQVLEGGGVCFGVQLNEELIAEHKIFYNIEKIKPFQGSKYVQSKMAHIYEEVEVKLETGKDVMFVGLPCQVAAIKRTFPNYKNLICCDLICNGVCSPLIFQMYVNQIENYNNKKVKYFYFRDKTNGWHKSNIKIIFNDNSEKIISRKNSDFFKLFSVLRTSCYNCQFKNFNIYSDITIGDFWGIETIDTNYDDEKGCSIVIINTQKGSNLFEKVLKDVDVIECNMLDAIRTHPKLIRSAEPYPLRDKLFKYIHKNANNKDCLKRAANIFLFLDRCRKLPQKISKYLIKS